MNVERIVTVTFAGRRDHYQVPRAFSELGWNVELVTDLYAPKWLIPLINRLDYISACNALKEQALIAKGISCRSSMPLICSSIIRRFFRRLSSVKEAERLGRLGGKIGAKRGGLFVCYSTYGYSSLPITNASGIPGVLFQMHPHAATCVKILEQVTTERRGLQENIEWEYRLNQRQYSMFMEEWRLAHRIIAASTFTKRSLMDAGANPDRIDVVPYGVSTPAKIIERPTIQGNLPEALFVGSFVRRKGALDFAELSRRLCGVWRFVAIGRGQCEPQVRRAFDEAAVEVVTNASEVELARRRAEANVFLFPSYLEGFGLVITEAMGAGLPVLTTTHTCAPDLIRNGIDGFVLEPGDVDGFEKALRELEADRARLAAMSKAIQSRAREWTWARFRAGIVKSVERLLP